MNSRYQISNPVKGYVRTNIRTVEQRAALLMEFLPGTKSIAEICCGDCFNQWQVYTRELNLQKFLGLDLQPAVVELNKSRGVACLCGDALDKSVLKKFLDFDVIFFGPPLSVGCDGHRLFSFRQVTPGYADFARLLIGELKYRGTLICTCPKTATLGDVQKLYTWIKSLNNNYGIPLIHYSHSDVMGDGATTEVRLKYIDVWFSTSLGDRWEIRDSSKV